MIVVVGLWTFLRALFLEPATFALENLALRHQLLVLQRSVRRPRLHGQREHAKAGGLITCGTDFATVLRSSGPRRPSGRRRIGTRWRPRAPRRGTWTKGARL